MVLYYSYTWYMIPGTNTVVNNNLVLVSAALYWHNPGLIVFMSLVRENGGPTMVSRIVFWFSTPSERALALHIAKGVRAPFVEPHACMHPRAS